MSAANLTEAIARYRAGMKAYNEHPIAGTDESEEENAKIVAETYGPPHSDLADWNEPAATAQEAIDALQLAYDEDDGSTIKDILISAALSYFRGSVVAAVPGTIGQIYDLVNDMEHPSTVVQDMALTLSILCETEDSELTRCVQRLAFITIDSIKAVEGLRGQIFHLSHPRRAFFEPTGWPGDKGGEAS